MKYLLLITTLVAFLPAGYAAGGFSVEKTPSGGAIVSYNGKLVTEYVVDQANKPYLWPLVTPEGVTMTRAYPIKNVVGEKQDHPHHRGINFGHEGINGANTWAERMSYEDGEKKKPGSMQARIAALGTEKHKGFKTLNATGEKAELVALTDYLDTAGKVSGQDERHMIFHILNGMLTLDFDISFTAGTEPVTFEDKKDAGFSIRVPTSMSVDTKLGGRIMNSEGHADKDAWGKRAKWCDFNGPVDGKTVGVAMLNHPSSFRFPTPWHARTYGLFTANPFGTKSLDKTAPDGAFTLKPGEKLTLRHRLIFHNGDEKSAKITEAFAAYAAMP